MIKRENKKERVYNKRGAETTRVNLSQFLDIKRKQANVGLQT